MKISGYVLVLACIPLAHAGIRPSFWLSRCAWEATDVVELAVVPGEARFRVVATIKGGTRPGTIKTLPELTPPAGRGHSLLKDLVFDFPNQPSYGIAPPIRDVDRLIVFLRPGDNPANWTLLTSAIWLQDGVAYDFEQTMNPGPTHLVAFLSATEQFDSGKAVKPSPKQNEALVRAEIGRLLRWRQTFDHAIANSNPVSRAAELARLITSGDDIVIRGVLAKLNGEGPEAAHALRPYLDDDSLLNAHFQILDTIAVNGARDIRLDSIIRRETSYWTQTCHRTLDANWVRDYGKPPAFHYLRMVSALKTIRALAINSDLLAVRDFGKVVKQCQPLTQQQELVELTETLLGR